MRNHSFILGIAILAGTAAASGAFADEAVLFDYSRFPDSTKVAGYPQIEGRHNEPSGQEASYLLTPAGVAIRAAGSEEENNKRHELHASVVSLTSVSTGLRRSGVENKYSNVDGDTLCPPSPLNPQEIAELVAATALRHGVDPDFAKAVAWAESRFDQTRNSPKGARGPMQLMPDTADRFDVADICDPAANIEGGVRYLRVLIDRFKNPILAAAAYNAGEQAIYDNNGVPPFPETVRYVASVLNRQLGVDFSKNSPGPVVKQGQVAEATQSVTDVIGARTPTFISGVMQF
jgi:hypothetical protein